MGVVFSLERRYDKAHEHLLRALVIREKALGPKHPLVAVSLAGIGSAFVDQGRYHEARMSLERAVSLCEKKTCEAETHGLGPLVLRGLGGDR